MVLAIAVVVLYAADLVVIEPMFGWWKTRAKTIAELREQVKNGRRLIQREAGLRGRWSRCARTPCRTILRWRNSRRSRPLQSAGKMATLPASAPVEQ